MAETPRDPGRDWPEDAVHENGEYCNTCVTCGEVFVGHKRRLTCKPCFERWEASRAARWRARVEQLSGREGEIRARLAALPPGEHGEAK